MRINRYILLIILCSLFMGCNKQPSATNFDGVYNAYPIPQCMSTGSDYMLIDQGTVQLYGKGHHILQEAGEIKNGIWNLWPDHKVLLTKTTNGLAMQVKGEDKFIEFPKLPMTKNEFLELEASTTNTTDQFLEQWKDPPIPEGGWDAKWKTRRKWTDVYGHDRVRIEPFLEFEPVISSNTLYVTLTYKFDEPFGLVFNPRDFHGKLYLIKSNGQVDYEEFSAYEENDLVMMTPGQRFEYSEDLELCVDYDLLPKAGDMYFVEMQIDAPSRVLRSNLHKVKTDQVKDEPDIIYNKK